MEGAAEVQELRNKLRMMKFPQDDIINVVRRQQRAISKQRQANETIRGEIEDYEREIAKLESQIAEHQSNEKLQRLESSRKALANRLSILKADLAAEEARRRKLADEVSRTESKQGGMYRASQESEAVEGRIRTMENRLDKEMMRYNSLLQVLTSLRTKIDELRKDRFNFRETCQRADQARERRDKEVGELIKASNEAYAERDRRRIDLARLREAEKTDVAAYEERLERMNQQIESHRLAQARTVENPPPVASTDSAAASGAGAQDDDLSQRTDQMEARAKAIFEKMQVAGPQELFAAADSLDAEEFSLFKYVQEMGKANARLEEEIEALEYQQQMIADSCGKADEKMSAELLSLQDEIALTGAKLGDLQAARDERTAELSELYKGVEDLFVKLKCDWEDSPDGKQNVTTLNAMWCLAAVETAITELMKSVYEKAKGECQIHDVKFQSLISEERLEQLKRTPGQPIGPSKSVIGDRELVSKVAESPSPLTFEEMKALVA